jgi:transcriptional regulator with XRE-family HTH domain
VTRFHSCEDRCDDSTAPVTGDFDVRALGQALRTARRERGLTVEALATSAGVSSGLISQLERGQGNPAFLTLRRLAEALGLPVAHFVQGPPSSGMLVRAEQRKRLHLPDADLVYELLTPSLQGKLEVLITQIPAGWTNVTKPFVHEGEECIHLLEGTLEVTVGETRFVLEEGDSLTYEAQVPHWYANASGATARLLGAVTPPSF